MKNEILTYIKETILSDSSLELTPEDDLLNSGLIDSIGIVKLVAFLEKEFNVSIPPEEMLIENFVDVNAIVEFLKLSFPA